MNNINDIQKYNNLAMEIMGEPEFRPGGFVFKHIKERVIIYQTYKKTIKHLIF